MTPSKDPKKVEDLSALLRDRSVSTRDRAAAIPDLCSQNKRSAFPSLLELLRDPEEVLRREAILQAPRLHDSRLLFALINLFHSLDLESPGGLQTGEAILNALSTLRDPRSPEWLKIQASSKIEGIASTANAALRVCDPDRLDFSYTYIGPDSDLRRATESTSPRVPIRHPSSLDDAALRKFLREERHGELSYALFVVLPKDHGVPFTGGCELVLAPWRTEHYMAAQGGDVLSAGVVGLNGDVIEEITNQSGGYYPSMGSFAWVRRALKSAGIDCPHTSFTQGWPPDGYASEGVLCRFPLFRRSR